MGEEEPEEARTHERIYKVHCNACDPNIYKLARKDLQAWTLLQDIFRNQGGFDMICSGRDKIESLQDLQKAAAVATKLELDGIVVAGGDDSNTNAAVMAEYFASQGRHQAHYSSLIKEKFIFSKGTKVLVCSSAGHHSFSTC